MLNLETESIIHSRDVVWLNKRFDEWFSSRSTSKDQSDYGDDEEFIERIKKLNCPSNEEVTDESRRKKKHLIKCIKK
jgi:hypothetical protein